MGEITQEVNIEMLEKLPDGNYKLKYPKTKAENIIDLNRYAATTGSANTYVASIPGISNLVAGLRVTVKINVANTGASTLNVNGLGAKSLRKSGGATLSAGNLKPGGVYTLVYDGSSFILQGEGGEYGTATPADVLAGKTIGTEDGVLPGTMPDNGTVNHSLPINGSYTIPSGYHSGSGKVTQSVPTKGAQIYTPGTTDQAIAANQYLTGIQTLQGDANFIESNIRQGVNMWGKVGSYAGPIWHGVLTAPGGRFIEKTGLPFRPVVGIICFMPSYADLVLYTWDTTKAVLPSFLYSNDTSLVKTIRIDGGTCTVSNDIDITITSSGFSIGSWQSGDIFVICLG